MEFSCTQFTDYTYVLYFVTLGENSRKNCFYVKIYYLLEKNYFGIDGL